MPRILYYSPDVIRLWCQIKECEMCGWKELHTKLDLEKVKGGTTVEVQACYEGIIND